jgi:hypothetical protein
MRFLSLNRRWLARTGATGLEPSTSRAPDYLESGMSPAAPRFTL